MVDRVARDACPERTSASPVSADGGRPVDVSYLRAVLRAGPPVSRSLPQFLADVFAEDLEGSLEGLDA